MAGKIKDIFRGFKSISHLFVERKQEMEIGVPTDVIHVAHVGADHSSTSAPSWMNEFKIGPDKTAESTGVSHPIPLSTLSSLGIDQSIGSESETEKTRKQSCTDVSTVTEKRKRKSNFIVEPCSWKSQRSSKTKETSTQLGFDQSVGYEAKFEKMKNQSCTDLLDVREKRKRRKKTTSIADSSILKSQRLPKTNGTFTQLGIDQSMGSEPEVEKMRNQSCTDMEKPKTRKKKTCTSESSSSKSQRLSKTKETSTQSGIDQSVGSELETEKMTKQSCLDLPNVTEKRKRRRKSSSTAESSSSSKYKRLSKMNKISSQLDIDQLIGSERATEKMKNQSCTDLPNVMEKPKRRKKRSSTSESSSLKSQRLSKTKETSIQLGSSCIDQSMESEAEAEKMRNQSCIDLSNVKEKRKRRRKSSSTAESFSSSTYKRLIKMKKISTQLDIDQLMGSEPTTEKMKNQSCTDVSNVTEERKRRKRSSIAKSSSSKSPSLSKMKATSTQLGIDQSMGSELTTDEMSNQSCTNLSNVTEK